MNILSEALKSSCFVSQYFLCCSVSDGVVEEVQKQDVDDGLVGKLPPLYQSSPAVKEPETKKSDENFLIVSQSDSDFPPKRTGDVSLLVETLRKQVIILT